MNPKRFVMGEIDWEPKYNEIEREWVLAPKDATLQFNHVTRKYEYAPEGSEPRFNLYDRSYSMTPDDWEPQYNHITRRFDMAPEGSTPEFILYANRTPRPANGSAPATYGSLGCLPALAFIGLVLLFHFLTRGR